MFFYVILFLISCLVSLIVIPLLRQTAFKSNALDEPNGRKIHKSPIPRLGGIGIAIAFFFSVGVGYIFLPKGEHYSESILGICIGSSIVAFIGIWDDIKGLNATKKLLGQIAAVIATLPFGFIIRELNVPFIGIVEVNGIIGALLVIFWVSGIMNAINLIDGIDGLAGGITIKIASALFIISLLAGQMQMALICIALIGATIGFLRYNFHPATIFMGDCGALLIGFITSIVTVKVLFQNPNITSSSMIPVLLFGLPILDTTWAIIRRLFNRNSPFSADLGHLHHRFLRLGMTQRKATFILYIINLLSVGSGFTIIFLNSDILALIICVSMLIIGTGITLVLAYVSRQKESINNYELESNP